MLQNLRQWERFIIEYGAVRVAPVLVRQVANKTNDIAGDGTTTATVLTRAIFSEGCKAREAPPRFDPARSPPQRGALLLRRRWRRE